MKNVSAGIVTTCSEIEHTETRVMECPSGMNNLEMPCGGEAPAGDCLKSS